MPKDYLKTRDECYNRAKKRKGKLSDEDKKKCKQAAAVVYYKKHGKPVQHADAEEDPTLSDSIEIEILIEQLDLFGDLEKYDEWNNDTEE